MDELTEASPGSVLNGRYEVLRVIGRGARSIVYECLDVSREQRVALKQLRPAETVHALVRERLVRELPAVRRIEHRGLVAPGEVFEHDGDVWITMELIVATDLRSRLRTSGALPANDVAAIGAEVAETLSAAHRRGVLHRDVKPSNILLAPDGARLGDFGAAWLEGQALHSGPPLPAAEPDHLPPEAVAGGACDARSDVYALGMTLYTAVVGHGPRPEREGFPPAPRPDGYRPRLELDSVPVWLDEIVARATRAEPRERFATAEEVANALDERDGAHASRRPEQPPTLDVCVLCREPGTLGRAVCPHCEDEHGALRDTLLLADPEHATAADRQRLIGTLTGLGAGSFGLRRAAAGSRPLARLSRAQARRVGRRLAARGLPTRLVPADLAWTLLPLSAQLFALALLGAGFAVGLLGPPLACVGGVLAAAGLLVAAHWWTREDTVIGEPAPRSGPPASLTTRVVAVLGEIESGEARSLLVEILRLGRDIYVRAETLDERDACACALTETQIACCDASTELSGLDPLLDALELHGDRRYEPPPGLLQSHSMVETARRRLVQALLEATATLSHFRSVDMLEPDELLAELSEASQRLRDEVEQHTGVAKEALAIFPGIPR